MPDQRQTDAAIAAAVTGERATIGDRPSRLPRWMHRAYARMCGYFWLPCPLCGREFGGHEWRDVNGLPSAISVPGSPDPETLVYRQRGICPVCTAAGRGEDLPGVVIVRSAPGGAR